MLFVSDSFELSKDKIVVLTKFYPKTKLTNTANTTANILKSKDGINWLALTSLASGQSADITLEEGFIYLTVKEDTTVYFQHQTPNHYHSEQENASASSTKNEQALQEIFDKIATLTQVNKGLVSAISSQEFSNEQKQIARNNIGAVSVEQLKVGFDRLSIDGRNLVLDSSMVVQNDDYLIKSYPLTPNHGLAHGDDVVITIWGQLADTKTAFCAFNSGGKVPIGRLAKIRDGVYMLKTKWKIASGKNTANNTALLIYTFIKAQAGKSRIDKIKLERGNMGTDWTQAPEDLQSLIDALIARITALENK